MLKHTPPYEFYPSTVGTFPELILNKLREKSIVLKQATKGVKEPKVALSGEPDPELTDTIIEENDERALDAGMNTRAMGNAVKKRLFPSQYPRYACDMSKDDFREIFVDEKIIDWRSDRFQRENAYGDVKYDTPNDEDDDLEEAQLKDEIADFLKDDNNFVLTINLPDYDNYVENYALALLEEEGLTDEDPEYADKYEEYKREGGSEWTYKKNEILEANGLTMVDDRLFTRAAPPVRRDPYINPKTGKVELGVIQIDGEVYRNALNIPNTYDADNVKNKLRTHGFTGVTFDHFKVAVEGLVLIRKVLADLKRSKTNKRARVGIDIDARIRQREEALRNR